MPSPNPLMPSDRPSGSPASAFESSEVKGLWFVTARKYAVHKYGEAAIEDIVAAMKPRYRDAMASPLPSGWYPEEAMQDAFASARKVLAEDDDDRMLELFEGCSLIGITSFWRIALRVMNTEFALRMLPVTWRHFRRGPGVMEVKFGGLHAEVSEVGDEPPAGRYATVEYSRFPYFDDVNYRLLVLGTLRPLLRIATGKPARVDIAGHGKSWLSAAISFE